MNSKQVLKKLIPVEDAISVIHNGDVLATSGDDDAMEAYMDAVRYVEKQYYLKVSRFTNSGFLRIKLGKELESRQASSHVFETRQEAERNLAGEQ